MNPIIQIILFILKFTLQCIHILDDSVIHWTTWLSNKSSINKMPSN